MRLFTPSQMAADLTGPAGRELIVDLFAGAGGASMGLEADVGQPVASDEDAVGQLRRQRLAARPREHPLAIRLGPQPSFFKKNQERPLLPQLVLAILE